VILLIKLPDAALLKGDAISYKPGYHNRLRLNPININIVENVTGWSDKM
jgi:hypothetical protein